MDDTKGLHRSPQRSASAHRRASTRSSPSRHDTTTYTDVIRRSPPAAPPELLRRLAVKEASTVGKVKVMLRVAGGDGAPASFLGVDCHKKQVALFQPSGAVEDGAAADQDRRVVAPKLFSFDALFTQDHSQGEVCSSALADVIHAVISGSDGCVFSFGHPGLGKTNTMLGSASSAHTLGVMPCAIAWLYRAIAETKVKTGARFMVRVSAAEIALHQRDLLTGHADGELQQGLLSEVRAPTAEQAACCLDVAAGGRSKGSFLLYRMHVLQQRLTSHGQAPLEIRSRLHLIDVGNPERDKNDPSLSVSGLGNVLIAIFNGRKYLPHREHAVTQLMKDCLGSLTCHAAMVAHVSSSSQHYTDTLTTLQLASRIHRIRHFKSRFMGSGGGASSSCRQEPDSGDQSNGSSDVDVSSSELSADTVIYLGPSGHGTDGEHPPSYPISAAPAPAAAAAPAPTTAPLPEAVGSPSHRRVASIASKPKSKGSPSRSKRSTPVSQLTQTSGSPVKLLSDEQWIDGPRISKSKLVEARNLHKNRHKKLETWIDGPLKSVKCACSGEDARTKKVVSRKNDDLMVSHKQEKHHGKHPKQNQQKCTDVPDKQRSTASETKETDDKVTEKTALITSLKVKTEDSHSKCHKKERTSDNVTHDSQKTDENECCQILRNIYMKDSYSHVRSTPPLSPAKLRPEQKITPMIPKPQITQIVQPRKQEIIKDSEPEPEKQVETTKSAEKEESETESIISETEEVPDEKDFCEMVAMQDSCLQVTEEDIDFYFKTENPVPISDQGDRSRIPLESNKLTTKFNESPSRDHMVRSARPYSVHALPDDYLRALSTSQQSLEQLSRLRESYSRTLSKVGLLSTSLCDVVNADDDSDSNSVYSEPAGYVSQYDEELNICDNCKCGFSPWFQPPYPERTYSFQCGFFSTHTSISSLRHPDGASNPDLKESEKLLPEWKAHGKLLQSKSLSFEDDDDPPPEVPPPLNTTSRLTACLWGQRPPALGEASTARVARVTPRPKPSTNLDSMSVLQYCREDVARLERRWTEVRAGQVRELQSQQAGLRQELSAAKTRLLLPPSRWGYELHVEESMDPRAPGFVEALQRETEILGKRVAACKSRIMMATCFDSPPQAPD